MLYTDDLENLISSTRPESTDEIIIISGYATKPPIERLARRGGRMKVIIGMTSADGIQKPIHEDYLLTCQNYSNLEICYTNTRIVHAKCYAWRGNGLILHSFVGSANFTHSGLNTPKKEILMDVATTDFQTLNQYINEIIVDSAHCSSMIFVPRIRVPARAVVTLPTVTTATPVGTTIRFSLLTDNGRIPTGSGINWGHGPSGTSHTNKNDAYIRIPRNVVNIYKGFFNPKNPQRNMNTPLDLLWDDGMAMRGLAEGNQLDSQGVTYPKQLASYPEKKILGQYLRHRLGVASESFVTMDALNQYGRSHIDITLIGPNSYFLNFRRP